MEYVKLRTSGRHERDSASAVSGAFIARVETVKALASVYLEGQNAEAQGAQSLSNPYEHKSPWKRAAWLLGYQSEYPSFPALAARIRCPQHEEGPGRCSSRALVDAIEDAREAEAAKAVAA